MREHSPDGLMSPGLAHLGAPAADDVPTGQPLDVPAADLALRATRYLRTRFRERVTVGDLSAHLAYSPSHLTRVFTSVVGTSPMDYLAAWRLHEAKHLLISHRLGVAETCHEVGYSSVGTFSRRFLRDVGIAPGALRRLADRVSERTLPAVSLLVPAAGRIRIRLDIPEEMRRALGPAPYQWVGTFPRPVPSGLPTSGTLRRHIDEIELPVVPGSPWILATIFPDGADVLEQLAPTSPLVARLRVPEEPAPLSTGIPRFSWRWRRWWSDGRLRWPEKGAAQESRIGVVRGAPAAYGRGASRPLWTRSRTRKEPLMTDATANAQPAERLAGFPCWIELYSPDIDASAAFYRDLLGWEITPAEPGEPLTTEVHHDGRLIGSFEPAEEAHGDPGWRVSFMVDDVRTAAGAAERVGGGVVVEPTDVTETMAYALASDPDGNVVGLLEGEDFEGPYPYHAGMPVWFDVLASDLEPAERFYREVAGWSTRRLTIADQEQDFYTSVVGGRSVSGVGRAGYFGEEIPSRWRIYFGVEDADAAARRVRELGGAVIVEPIDFTFGRMVEVADPHGARFLLTTF